MGASRATSHIAQFQNSGAVENLADTEGTPRHRCVESTSGRWYRNAERLPMPRPKSTTSRLLTGGALTCGRECMNALCITPADAMFELESLVVQLLV